MNAKKIAIGALATIVGVGAALFLWVWFAPCALGGCAPLDRLAEYQAEGSSLLDVNGEPFARLATVDRRIVSIDSLPAHLPEAFVAIEDQRFYDHGGVDFFRTAGALVQNVQSGGVAEGGSTITQQLARNLFPDWLPYTQRNVRRKLLEARVARQIERSFDKKKILELYINHIYLGSGAYGVEAAAQTYFGKPAAELDLAESAMIAGLPQSPSRINPKENLERATERRNLVLDQMVDAGYITSAEASSAQGTEIAVVEEDASTDGPRSSYFVERVRQELEERIGNRFYTAGLQIQTTLDPSAQVPAEQRLNAQLSAIESGRFGTYRHATYASARDSDEEGSSDYLQGAVVVMDSRTGAVRALVGGRDFDDSKFDRASQALRQPGSAFKPFVYLAGLQRYRTPAHIIDDSPVRLTMDGQVWEPRNYTGSYDGPMTMRDAITRSKNAATVNLAQEVGIRSAIALAHDLGVTSDIPDYPSTALGAAEVRPIELVAAYAAIGNGGNRVEPYFIERVVDRDGRVLWENEPRTQNVLDSAVAYVMTTMLRDVVTRGTGSAVRAVGFRGPAAGKTGTTNNASDAWFVGFTPELAAGVWIGLDEPETIVRGASGGTLAAPVWGRIMNDYYSEHPVPDEWAVPSGITTAEVDRATGAAITPECPAIGGSYTEYFIRTSPVAQRCPRPDYRYSFDDSLWTDEEWAEYDIDLPARDTVGGGPGGINWPELEALRRRVERARDRVLGNDDRERADSSQGGFDPGDILTGPPGRSGPDVGRDPGDPSGGLPANEPPPSPPGAGNGNAGGNGGGNPPTPDQDTGAPSAEPPSDDGPALLGTPVGQ